MALINEDAAVEVIGGMKAARSAAYEQIERGKTRLRSTSKTRKSRETRQRIMDATVQNVQAYLDGAPINVVN